MSSKDVRCSIILESIPHLIEELSGIKKSDDGYARLEHSVLAKIQNHHFLSVNGHEIQRRMDSVGERFTVANFDPYAVRLAEIVDKVKEDPLCKEHYESDIHWALMSFLLEISRNPVAGLEANKNEIKLSSCIETGASDEDEPPEESEDDKGGKVARTKLESTEDLSEWSSSDDDGEPQPTISTLGPSEPINVIPTPTGVLSGIKPPSKLNNFQSFDDNDPIGWLKEHIQPSWWLDKTWQNPSSSVHPEASFCHFWAKHQSIIYEREIPQISTLSEYCLIKEILWMFVVPTTCKMFVVDYLSSTVSLADNVSINSVSVLGIQSFLQYFARHMTIVLRLNTFCGYVNGGTDQSPPHSYEAYVQSLQQCLQPFNEFILSKESELSQQDQRPDCVSSLIRLQRDMEPFGRFLDNLYDIHCTSTLDYVKYPAHICSSYMIASLLRAHSNSSSKCHSSLAAVLFMGTIKVYLQIIDTWWTDGRLEDWRNEFVIKNVERQEPQLGSPERGDDYEVRLLSPNQDRAFFIPDNVATVIESCVLTKLLCKFAMQAGYTLNILHALDRIGEIKSQCGYKDNLYDTFWQLTLAKVAQYEASEDYTIVKKKSTEKHEPASDVSLNKVDRLRSSLVNQNPMLALVFEASLKKCEVQPDPTPISINEKDTNHLYQVWQNTGAAMLPFDEIVMQNLSALLKSRIASANRCVINMYMDEYLVLNHFHNLAKVYFLGAGDLMFLFFSTLFKQIESIDNWNKPYILTDQLNGIICTKFPDMSSLFSVHVSSRKFAQRNVLDAIKNISIAYAVPSSLQNVIDASCLIKYNEVFRFLLKIKWALWSLEVLRFPVQQKKRPPYLPMTYFDLTFKRLALVRFWIQNTMQCLHSHLMTEVVQAMVDRLDTRIAECQTLTSIVSVHKSYINTIHNYCFLAKDDRKVMVGIEQLLTLVCVVRNEWANLDEDEVDSAAQSQIDEIEDSYIHCHSYLSDVLNTQLYSKQQNHLSGLCAAFSSSCPY